MLKYSILKAYQNVPLITLFLCGLIMVTVGSRIFCTYSDEVIFADPAIHFLEKGTHNSTATGLTKSTEIHVSTAPLASLALIAWFDIVGWSLRSTRLWSIILALTSSVIVLIACKRLSIISTPLGQAIMVSSFLLSYGFSFSYNCGRPDSLSALMASLLLYSYSLRNALGLLMAVILGILMPFTQYALIIYTFSALFPLVIVYRTPVFRYALYVTASVIAGFLLQYVIYLHFDVWDTWRNAIGSEGSSNVIQRVIDKLTSNPFMDHQNRIPKDFSSLVLIAGLAICYSVNLITKQRQHNTVLGIGLAIAVTVTCALYFVGKFPTYYGWMLALPLSIVTARFYEISRLYSLTQSRFVLCFAFVSILVGLPMQAGLAMYDWKDRQPEAFEQWLSDKVHENDVVFCDWPFYFAVRSKVKQVYSGTYYKLLTEAEKSEITVAIISTHDSKWGDEFLLSRPSSKAMQWVPTRSGLLGNDSKFGILSAANYDCTVYRLRDPASR